MATSRSVDVELAYDRFLGEGEALLNIYRFLAEYAPKWCEGLRVYRGPHDQETLDPASVDLRDVVLRAAAERGETYRALVAQHGAGDERLFGSVELRGASPDLTVVISVDERRVSPLGDALQLGNTLALQLRRSRVQGKPASAWAVGAMHDLAGTTSPAWGAISSGEEYDAKVMSDGAGVATVGRDFGRYLPGLFTANFFGRPYVDLIGRERLLAVRGARPVDDGVLIMAGEDPAEWNSAERRSREDELLEHLGREHFFSKTAMPAMTRAPDWTEEA